MANHPNRKPVLLTVTGIAERTEKPGATLFRCTTAEQLDLTLEWRHEHDTFRGLAPGPAT